MERRDQGTERVRFERIEQQRAHEYVAEQIRRQIILRLIPSGQALPPERDLAAMFGVGRATVQQAMRLLVEDRMIEGRRGKGGGNFVLGPDENRSGDGPAARPPGPAAGSARGGARLPPRRRARRGDARRRGPVAYGSGRAQGHERGGRAARTDVEFMQADTAFHLALAEAAGKRFFREAIEPIRLELNDALIALPDSHVWHERSALEHEAILQAVTDRDPANAAAAMERHIVHTEQSVEALLAALAPRAGRTDAG